MCFAHFYKVKAQAGTIGNKAAGACARPAASMCTPEITLPNVKTPSVMYTG